mmetsp:Transcript_20111/g.41333  ORF Transcript_20111/g.41333 Transcript_20111/m.41333 type:complete len:80 (-) Transcript_20111:934-1173(-)
MPRSTRSFVGSFSFPQQNWLHSSRTRTATAFHKTRWFSAKLRAYQYQQQQHSQERQFNFRKGISVSHIAFVDNEIEGLH